MKNIRFIQSLFVLLAISLIGTGTAMANGEALRLQKVDEHVYAIVGPFGNRTPENLGNNATFGFVVTEAGVVLIDSGGSYQGAAAIDTLIQQVTDQPVTVVVNTGGQDHRWLGNGYFKERGAHIIASEAAVDDQRSRLQDQRFVLSNLVGEKGMAGTEPVYADEVFAEGTDFVLGGTAFELQLVGPAHTPGDSVVWLPAQRVVFTGDVVYVGRLLGVMSHSSSRNWIDAFGTVAALEPRAVVPGHGPATDLAQAREDTLDYLVFLRETVGSFMDAGGSITEIGTLDQSHFTHLQDYEALKGRNAQQVYQEMEWE
ncbi:MBL fold metallo-hydrolase [Thiohalomonas denitrificans]|uniref:MBL fold metallo-hydrolase n=1 Tax=Thiohalomonas denitrificans TaxID=415747 RepID=UPI0026ECDD20|nr:MBL fold metallo-hydrolase [Thiohalomonas denitrificans]